jgi:starch phosphorylase
MSPAKKSAAPKRTEAPRPDDLLTQYGCGPVRFSGSADGLYERHLVFDNVVPLAANGPRERFEAVARSVRDVLSQRWIRTEETYAEPERQARLLPLHGVSHRALARQQRREPALDGLVDEFAAREHLDVLGLLEEEPDAGLGNGGLGRLAACFLDSMATLELPAMGYGLRYEYGIFKQTLRDGAQREEPDNWLRRNDPWEVARPQETVEIPIACDFEVRGGSLIVITDRPSRLIGVPYDRPVVGYGGKTVNTLRLWAARADHDFDFAAFSQGEFVGALADRLAAESLTRVLYPDDSTSMGQGLRFVQEYFLVACSLADLVRRFRRTNRDWSALPEKVAVQLNDTHPAMAVPELMRILLDEALLPWDQAWDLTRQTLAYTNHTLLPEALERWPLRWFKVLLPRHLDIILEINRRLLDDVRARFPGDAGRVGRVSLIEEGADQKVRMANLAIAGSHSTNGVAAIHSHAAAHVDGARSGRALPRALQQQDQRRHAAALAAPRQSRPRRGHHERHRRRLDHRPRAAPEAGPARRRSGLPRRRAGGEAPGQAAIRGLAAYGHGTDRGPRHDLRLPGQAHPRVQAAVAQRTEGGRALPAAAREPPPAHATPDVLVRGQGRAAYRLAKVVIQLINRLAVVLERDAAVRDRLRVVFLPDYGVSLAERLIPAADVSNQISTAGYEASGTSNMKFMMNGALTLGTRDGATIEMAETAGDENFFLFGLTAEQVAGSRGWYSPYWHYEHEPETRTALDLILSDEFTPADAPGVFTPVREALLTHGDHYMHLADLRSYLEADGRLVERYADRDAWTRRPS